MEIIRLPFVQDFSSPLIALLPTLITIAVFMMSSVVSCSRQDLLEGTDVYIPDDPYYIQVVSVYPENGSDKIPANATLEVIFNDNIDMTTVNSSNFIVNGGAVTGIFSYENQLKKVMFKPDPELVFGTSYMVTLTKDIKNVAGESMLSDYSWSFKTALAGVPRIEIKSPIGIMANGDTYNFGGVINPETKVSGFTILNSGTAPLEIFSALLTGDDSDNYLSDLAGLIIPALSEYNFNLTFIPDVDTGPKTASLSIQGNDYNNEYFTFKLNGVSLAGDEPQVQITMNGSVLINETGIVDFGTVKNHQSKVLLLTLHNIGSVDLIVAGVTLGGNNPGFFSTSLSASTINFGCTMDFNIIFSPTSLGVKKALIYIYTNDSDSSPFVLELRGRSANLMYFVGIVNGLIT